MAPHLALLVAFYLRISCWLQTVYDGMPKLLVFGGNGFVGTRVCEEAVSTGLQIVSINRSGRPRQNAPWVDQVDWIQARS